MATQNSPANYSPYLRGKTLTTQTFTTGNTQVITDANVHSNSLIVIQNISVPAGRWGIAVSEGTFTITSSDGESAATFVYQAF